MAGEEIIGGLKNALERGESLDSAKITFINAGYKKEDVEEAAKQIDANATRKALKEVAKEETKNKKGNHLENAKVETVSLEKPLPTINVKPKKKIKFITKFLIGLAVIIFLLILNIIRDMMDIKLF